MFKWNKEFFFMFQDHIIKFKNVAVLTIKWIFRLILKKSITIFSKTLIFSQGERGNWCISKDLFKVLTGDRLERKFSFKKSMQNQLISEDWRFLCVFCQDFYKQYEPFTVLHRSQQIALCFLATAFQNMSHGSLTIAVVMLWSKISSGDRMDIVVFIFITLF